MSSMLNIRTGVVILCPSFHSYLLIFDRYKLLLKVLDRDQRKYGGNISFMYFIVKFTFFLCFPALCPRKSSSKA